MKILLNHHKNRECLLRDIEETCYQLEVYKMSKGKSLNKKEFILLKDRAKKLGIKVK